MDIKTFPENPNLVTLVNSLRKAGVDEVFHVAFSKMTETKQYLKRVLSRLVVIRGDRL